MAESKVRIPAIRQGWLRVLLFCLVFFAALVLAAIPVGLIIVWIKRDEILRGKVIDARALMTGEFLWLTTLLGLIFSLLLVVLFTRFLDGKKFSELGFRINGAYSDLFAGFFLAPVVLGAGTLVLMFSGHLEWTDITPDAQGLVIDIGILLIVAFMEELVFRAYILGNLMSSFNRWVALALSAFLFGIFHMNNAGFAIIPFVNLFLAGILLGINYTYTRNLWFAILFHFSWNFFEGSVLGFRVSSVQLHSLLQNTLTGDISLTGGEFGFEGSVVAGGLTFISIIVLYWIYEKKYALDPAGTPVIAT